MKIWRTDFSLDDLNRSSRGTMMEHLAIEYTEMGDDYLKARMPVDNRTKQPAGLLHGGASVALAESLGSVGSYLCVDPQQYECVGLEINANHLRAVREGFVEGTVRPIRLGRRIQVWEITIHDQQKRLVCVSRLTMAVIEKRG